MGRNKFHLDMGRRHRRQRIFLVVPRERTLSQGSFKVSCDFKIVMGANCTVCLSNGCELSANLLVD